MSSVMYVVKRDGRREIKHSEKITNRIRALCYGLSPEIDYETLSSKVQMGLYDGVPTTELDALAARMAHSLSTHHSDYDKLAARIAVSDLHKNTRGNKAFSTTVRMLYEHKDPNGEHAPMVNKQLMEIVNKHAERIDAAIVYARDFNFKYFGFTTLARSYLLKLNGRPVERPQHMIMRCALGIHGEDIDSAIETYELTSLGLFTHATPTLLNAGRVQGNLISCFLLQVVSDSINGIYETIKDTALISSRAGGIGLALHKIRSNGAYIRTTGGKSDGIVPLCKVLNDTARYVNQSGSRKGAIAVYLEPWHADVEDFLELRKNQGVDELRARDLFYALWVPDLFMRRVLEDGVWHLMCPDQSRGLSECHGEAFEKLYEDYERQGKFKKAIPARDLWKKIITAQMETGTPYILFKDAANRKSNQRHLGTIQSSNLCTEIIEYTAPDEIACCNLASVALPKFVTKTRFGPGDFSSFPTRRKFYNVPDTVTPHGNFCHSELANVVRIMTINLNKVIDVNVYPTEAARRSNMRHRPIGIGVQGLADVFQMLNMPYDSPEAQQLNKEIFATIYYAACDASVELAGLYGPYESYKGSPTSEGLLRFDLETPPVQPDPRWDWADLKRRMAINGRRNSLLVAPMPTAATSQILGNTESFEPLTNNTYVRKTLSGEFTVVNHYLMHDLRALGLWNEDMRKEIIANNGSLEGITKIPQHVRDVYKTVWEMKNAVLIRMAADRGAYIDQSQSFNMHMAVLTFQKVGSYLMAAWKAGLITGSYYIRTQQTANAQKATIDVKKEEPKEEQPVLACRRDNPDCLACSS